MNTRQNKPRSKFIYKFTDDGYFAITTGKDWIYYSKIFSSFVNKDSNISYKLNFSLKAFFFQNFLFFYRKMLLEGFISTAFSIALPFLLNYNLVLFTDYTAVKNLVFIISYLVLMIVHGLSFNFLYFLSIKRRVDKLTKQYGHNEYLLTNQLFEKGGVSTLYIFIGLFLSFFLNGLFSLWYN